MEKNDMTRNTGKKNGRNNKGNKSNKNNRSNKRYNSEDKVLRMAIILVVLLLILGASFVWVRSLNPRPDITKGVARLEAMDKASVKDAEKKIETLEAEEARLQEERDKRPLSEKFENAVIFGDFLAQGVYEQEILGESFVIAKESACVHDMDGTGVTENLEAAAQKAPQVLFLQIGSNDAALEEGSADIFEEDYRRFLEKVSEKLPNTKIYVNSILPVQQKVIAETETLADIPEYNKKLQALCKETGAVYLDNSDLVTEECYKDDGKRMRKKYYTAWINRAVQVADL